MSGFFCGGDFCMDDYCVGNNHFFGNPDLPMGFEAYVDTHNSMSFGVRTYVDNEIPLAFEWQAAYDAYEPLPLGVNVEAIPVAGLPFEIRLYIPNEHNLPLASRMYIDSEKLLPLEVLTSVDSESNLPWGFRSLLQGYADNPLGFRFYVDTVGTLPMGLLSSVDTIEPLPMWGRFHIRNEQNLPLASRVYVDAFNGLPTEFAAVKSEGLPVGFRAFLYNVTQIRFMANYPSRGSSNTGNWSSTSTATGDFGTDNLNSDIIEQVWRSAGDLVVTLVCDTEVPQGIEMDTLAIINHNFSGGSTVTVIGSNEPDFSTIEYTKIIRETPPRNIITVENPRPTPACRYWRFDIVDLGNRDGYLQIGSIVFGSSEVFTAAENFNGRVGFEKRVHTDKVITEGFTSVENIRNRSNVLTITFNDLRTDGANYGKLQRMFDEYQTTHKILVIPYPQSPERFSVFSKLDQLPIEDHIQLGDPLVDFTLTFDESL